MARVSDSEVVAAARAEGVPVGVFRALVKQESGGDAGAVSPAGAFGPTQLMPATAQGLGVSRNSSPRALLRAGARYFKQQLERFGSVENALRAYNAGPGAVDASRNYAETNNYVRNILASARELGDDAPTGGSRMSDRVTPDADGQARRERAMALLNEQSAPAAAPAPSADTPQARYAALQASHGDPLAFAQQISALRSQDASAPAPAAPSKLVDYPAPRDNGGGEPAASGAGAGAVAFARQRVGHYRENTGSNRGDELDRLQQRFGLTGAPWCAMFATTAAAQGGMSRAGRTPAVAQVRAWATSGQNGYERGVRSARDARPGDLLMFGNAHIAVVESVGPDGITTIEGNTSGPGVTRRRRGWTGDVARPRYGRG